MSRRGDGGGGGAINGVETEYRTPDPSGAIDLPDACVDTIVCFGVLHHIPNVTAVLTELTRVLKPNGRIAIREPISSMGDYRVPRRGLTRNERGMPLPWLRELTFRLGLKPIYEAPCIFPATAAVADTLGIVGPFNYRLITMLDAVLCRLTRWNIAYERTSVFRKLAPGDIAMVLLKN